VTVSLDITFGDFRLNCSRTIDGIRWRDKALVTMEQELSEILIQILQPAVAAYDARRAAERRAAP
jgi:hypothetical protein